MNQVIDTGIEKKVSHLASQVADEARRRFGHNTQIYRFGSWVNGNPSNTSDLDIGIDLSSNLSSSDFIDFVDWVEDLPTLYRFDIINMAEISETFRNKITSKGRFI